MATAAALMCNTTFQTPDGPTCPVSCIYYRGAIHVGHFLGHAKMPKMTSKGKKGKGKGGKR